MIQMKKNWQTQRKEYLNQEIKLPKVDGKLIAPNWIHFGGGNLYRGLHAEIAQNLLDSGELKHGVTVVETFDDESVEKAYVPYNNQILQVVMLENEKIETKLLDSTAEVLYGINDNQQYWKRLQNYFKNSNLQFTTFTITEKGYNLLGSDGEFLPIILEDIKKGPETPKHTMSIVASLLYSRYKANKLPIAMISTDNFSRNGEKFRDAIITIAEEWVEKEYVPKEFISYLSNPEKVSFPWSMIDRITPHPSEDVLAQLKEKGFKDLKIFKTSKNTVIAPFVNTEEISYLVLEDSFPNGRPDFTKSNILLTNQETVDKADTMKVTTCLNPLHTALAIYGSILRINSIAEAVRDPELRKLIEKIGYDEGLPVVENPEIINPKEFIDEVITKRFSNPSIPDTPQRIATDTSQKLAIRFGETIKKYMDDPEKTTADLTFIPLVLAGWLRYLLAVDDNGESFTLSGDPLLEELEEKMGSITLGSVPGNLEEILSPVLTNENIFGVDLYEANLAEITIEYFKELITEKKAVRRTLKKYLK